MIYQRMITMNKYKVYMHICPNGKKYIGITQQDVLKRWNYGNGYKGCVLFYKWYIFANIHMNETYKNAIWDYLNQFEEYYEINLLNLKRFYKAK